MSMRENPPESFPAPGKQSRHHTRRGFLSIPPLVAAAFVLAPVPARADTRKIECLADLKAF